MKPSNKKTISFCLLALFAWSSLFAAGDGLLLCLHDEGSAHIGDTQEEECCHQDPADASELNINDQCENCTDVEISGNEITSIRSGSSRDISMPAMAVSHFLTELISDILPNVDPAIGFIKTTPKLPAQSVAIARQLVLRL